MNLVIQPICCPAHIFHRMDRLESTIETWSGLISALATASALVPKPSGRPVGSDLRKLADVVKGRFHGTQPQARLAHLHKFFFEDLEFCSEPLGEIECDDPLFCCIDFALATSQGVPPVVCAVYGSLIEALGMQCQPLLLPGHCAVRVCGDGEPMLVDPYHRGVIRTPAELKTLSASIVGEKIEWSDDFLKPRSHRELLTRVLQNMLHVYAKQSSHAHLARIIELEIILWPGVASLHRDLALLYAQLGMVANARFRLGEYLERNPGDPDRAKLQQMVNAAIAQP